MRRVISLFLILSMLSCVQLASAGGYGFNLIKVVFGGNEYYLAETETYTGEESSLVTLEILAEKIAQKYGENGENLQTVFFPATATSIDDYTLESRSNSVERVNLVFSEKAKTKNVVLEQGIRELFINFDGCSNLKTIVIPETVTKIILDGIPNYGSRCYTAEDAKRVGITHGQVINDGGRNTIVYVYSEIEKALGMKLGQLTQKRTNEFGGFYIALKPEYEGAVDNYIAQYEQSKYAKSLQGLVFYVKNGSYVEGYLKSIGFNVKQYVSVTYNGEQVYSDQPAIIVGGRTLIPMRAAFEAMSASVEWDASTRTVISERGGTNIKLSIGSNQLYINGNAKTLDVPAQIINGRTMVPARAVAEAFGCDVDWNNETRTAIIKE